MKLFKRKKQKIVVQSQSISLLEINSQDYICLTDMVKSKEGEFFVKDWLRNRNTLEFLAIWEQMHNPNFNKEGFEPITQQSGLNNFKISVKEWIEKTNAIGLIAQPGRYGGTYAHKDIAFEFGTWINPTFKLYLIKEYQRLKEIESNQYNLEWDVRRMVSKANYQIHTDAVKTHIIPASRKWRKELEYAEEADVLNMALFGCTAKEWRNANPDRAKNENILDSASINELIVISNLESLNAQMIKDGLEKERRFERLKEAASREIDILNRASKTKSLKKTADDIYLIEEKKK